MNDKIQALIEEFNDQIRVAPKQTGKSEMMRQDIARIEAAGGRVLRVPLPDFRIGSRRAR